MFPLLLLGAGLVGFMVGKKKPSSIGKVQSRSVLKEQRRRHESWQALRQAFRKGLTESLAVATAKTVYKTLGGTDVAFIARLDSYDKKTLEVGAATGRRPRPGFFASRKPASSPSSKPPASKPPSSKKPAKVKRRRFVAQSRSRANEEEELPEQEVAEGPSQGQEPPPAPAAAEATPAEPEEEESEEEGAEFPSEQTSAALAFTRAKDEGDDTEKARSKAKAVYQAMGGKDSSFLDMISGWSEE